MAEAIDFLGANQTFLGGDRGDVSDLRCFVNGKAIVSAWRLDADELEEINRTGTVFVSSLSGTVLFPIFIGSESSVRRLVADYGDVWKREGSAYSCAGEGCAAVADAFPTIVFAPADWPADKPYPYRLEVPRALCHKHSPNFDPKVYFTIEARAKMREMILGAGLGEPVFHHLLVHWRPISDAVFAELAGGGQARLWFG